MASLAMKASLLTLGSTSQVSLRGTSCLAARPTAAVSSAAPRLAVRAQAAEVAAEVATSAEAVAVEGVVGLTSQSDADRKAAMKDLKRRKRLNEKRELRKKGRWPPSKMKKNQNV